MAGIGTIVLDPLIHAGTVGRFEMPVMARRDWPGFGLISHVVSAFARKPVFGSLIHSVSRNPSLSKQLFGYAS